MGVSWKNFLDGARREKIGGEGMCGALDRMRTGRIIGHPVWQVTTAS